MNDTHLYIEYTPTQWYQLTIRTLKKNSSEITPLSQINWALNQIPPWFLQKMWQTCSFARFFFSTFSHVPMGNKSEYAAMILVKYTFYRFATTNYYWLCMSMEYFIDISAIQIVFPSNINNVPKSEQCPIINWFVSNEHQNEQLANGDPNGAECTTCNQICVKKGLAEKVFLRLSSSCFPLCSWLFGNNQCLPSLSNYWRAFARSVRYAPFCRATFPIIIICNQIFIMMLLKNSGSPVYSQENARFSLRFAFC